MTDNAPPAGWWDHQGAMQTPRNDSTLPAHQSAQTGRATYTHEATAADAEEPQDPGQAAGAPTAPDEGHGKRGRRRHML